MRTSCFVRSNYDIIVTRSYMMRSIVCEDRTGVITLVAKHSHERHLYVLFRSFAYLVMTFSYSTVDRGRYFGRLVFRENVIGALDNT